ncbi:hypothetical protein C8A05DRAFT_34431 [Staphylotrichum tortipilum]|uniref:Uncharacterized protein n=1 Tax=Staphylotrichum tortipilum TaxID=2831512 RepID=A0AAN6MKH8_9PEZI|nr:hypothetical protein C8A05DRAFT_34431 [Staphylotrichum longicolle]
MTELKPRPALKPLTLIPSGRRIDARPPPVPATVPARVPAPASVPRGAVFSLTGPLVLPDDTPITIHDLGQNYPVSPDDYERLVQQCPEGLISAIRGRMDAVRADVALFREEAAAEEAFVVPKRQGEEATRRDQPDEKDIRLRVLEDENKMLRECLIECASYMGGRRDSVSPSAGSAGAAHIDSLINELRESRRQRSLLEHHLARLQETVRQDGAVFERLLHADPLPTHLVPDCKPIIRHIRTDLEAHRALDEVLGPALTVRGVLALKTLQHQRPGPPSSPTPLTVAKSDLDTPLTLPEAADLARQLDAARHLLQPATTLLHPCALCHAPRFLRLPPISSASSAALRLKLLLSPSSSSSPAPLSEFKSSPTGLTPCCGKPLCDACLLPAVTSDLASAWWPRVMGRERWVRCPLPGCREGTLPVEQASELAGMLRACRVRDVGMWTRRFVRAVRLRGVVEELGPSREGVEVAVRFHEGLEKGGWLAGLFGEDGDGDGDGYTEDFYGEGGEVPEVRLLPMATDPARPEVQIAVPVFVGLIRPPAGVGRGCEQCGRAVRDGTNEGDEEERRWEEEVVKKFPGGWVWMVRGFGQAPGEESAGICEKCWARSDGEDTPGGGVRGEGL